MVERGGDTEGGSGPESGEQMGEEASSRMEEDEDEEAAREVMGKGGSFSMETRVSGVVDSIARSWYPFEYCKMQWLLGWVVGWSFLILYFSRSFIFVVLVWLVLFYFLGVKSLAFLIFFLFRDCKKKRFT